MRCCCYHRHHEVVVTTKLLSSPFGNIWKRDVADLDIPRIKAICDIAWQEDLAVVRTYCGWKNSCTSWYRCLYPLVVPLFTMVPFQYLPTGAGFLPSALSNDKDTKSIQR